MRDTAILILMTLAVGVMFERTDSKLDEIRNKTAEQEVICGS